MAYCEDYPCCGHTPEDPCGPQWYDKPGAFDTTIPGNEHALCDHENGDCDVEDYGDDEESEGEWSFDAHDGFPYPPEEMSLSDYEYERGYLSGSGEHASDSYINYLNNY